MQQKSISKTHQQFKQKQILYKGYNGVLFIWSLCQIVLYIVTIAQTKCSQMQILLSAYTICQAIYCTCAIFALIVCFANKYFTFTFALIGIVIACKIVVIATLIAFGWKHVGLCFLPLLLKIMIIAITLAQIICISIDCLLIWRIKKVFRQLKIQKIVNSKQFQSS